MNDDNLNNNRIFNHINKVNSGPTQNEIKNLVQEYQSGRFKIAIKLASSIINRFPNHQFTLKVLGALFGITGRLEESININQKLIDLYPNDYETYNNLGNSLKRFGRLEKSVESFTKAIELKPSYAEAHNNLGVTLHDLGKFEESAKSYAKAIELKPSYAEAHNNLGITFQELGKLDDSEKSYKKAIELKPDYAEAHNNLGNCLRILNQLENSEKKLKKAIELKPSYADAHNNLGVTLHELGKFEESVKSYAKAIELKPSYAEAHNNLGITFQELGKLDDSEKSYKKAIELKPDFAHGNFNLSTLLNLKANLKEGLKLYEWRLHKAKGTTRGPRKEFTWDGKESINGKKILVYEEQGIGDIIQFYRYLFLLQNKGAKVIFKVKQNLHHLFATSNKNIIITDNYSEISKIDFEIPLMSLPLLLKTDIESIPSSIPYLKANYKKINEWGIKLKSDSFKVGICWQGSKNKIDLGRSFSLSLFKDISKLSNLQLISLYKGNEEKQILDIDFDLVTLGNNFDGGENSFIDTAAVMMHCDLIITSDTVIAHLAGALGCKVWVLLKYIPDWRWMLKRTDSPWYPTMNLYRQNNLNDWSSVFDLIKTDLESIINK
jgi:tetratricopeptide (TPR) repeat protein